MGLSKKKNIKILRDKLRDLVSDAEEREEPVSVKESIDKCVKKLKPRKRTVGRKKEATLIDGGCLLTG
jgi:hypothetical protein